MPAVFRFQDSGQIEICFSEDMNDIGVGDVVNCVIARIEGLFRADGVAAGAFMCGVISLCVVGCCIRGVGISGMSIGGLACSVIMLLSAMIVMPVVILSVGERGEAAENQCNAIFANSCHIGY